MALLNLPKYFQIFYRLPAFPRFLCQSHFQSIKEEDDDDLYDPPFSLARTETLDAETSPRIVKKKKRPSKVSTKDKSAVAEEFPVKSDLPFDFMYSYSEISPGVEPISFREKKFSPFGPGRLDRNWTGTKAPAKQNQNSVEFAAERQKILGPPLSDEEMTDLIEKYRHSDCSRQINLGRGGVTHNTLEDIHNHWKRAEAVRIKCLGVPTLDMNNICFHLEDKTGGKIIYRHINILLLYRGRNYDPQTQPKIPVMLWKPLAPIYPKLVSTIAEGLSFEETKKLRERGLNAPPLMKLSRNGVYVNVVERVRSAFERDEVVRLECAHLGTSDCKKIGVKLRDLVPCVPLSIKDEQIVVWRGNKRCLNE